MKILLIVCTFLLTLSCTNDNAKLQIQVNTLEERVDSLIMQLSIQKMSYLGPGPDSSKQLNYSSPGSVDHPVQCVGITKKGKRCTRKIQSGTYCWQHRLK